MNKKMLFGVSMVFFILCAVSVLSVPSQSNLMYYYELESCSVAEDSSTMFNYDLTGVANTPDLTTGKVGKACYFTTNERIYRDSGLSNSSQIRTIDFWSNVSTVSKSEFGITNTTWSKDQIDFFHNSNRYFYNSFNGGAGTFGAGVSFANYTMGIWHHHVLVMTGTYWVYYLDGTMTANYSSTNLPLNIAGMYIGGEILSSNFATGIVDNIAVFNYPFTSSDVAISYNGGNGRNWTQYFQAPTESFDYMNPTPANNSIQFHTNNSFIMNTTAIYFGGTLNTTQYLYYENGTLARSISNMSDNVSNVFSGLTIGRYYFNATVSNGSHSNATETRLFTIYNLTGGSVTSNNSVGSQFKNITWTNGSTTNNSVNIVNFTLRLLYANGSLTTLYSGSNLFYYWDAYSSLLNTGVNNSLILMTNDARGNSVNYTQSLNVTKNAVLNVTAYDVSTNGSISNMILNVTDLSSNLSELWNTSGSLLNIDVIRGRNYSIMFDAQGYAYAYANYSTNNSILQKLNQSLYKTNSVAISVYDESSLALITNVTGGGLMNITFIGNSGSYSFNTTTGTLFVSNLTADFYEVKFNSPLYSQRSYYLNVTNRSTQTLYAYLSQSSINLLLTYVNKETGELIEGVGINVYKVVNGSWTAIATGFTDITGRLQVSVSTNTNYRFSSTIAGYDDKTFNLNPVIFTSYTIQLTKQSSPASQLDLSNINVYVSNTTFRNNGSNTFTWQISAPSGNLESYGYTLRTPCKNITSHSGINAYGGINSVTFNLSCASTSQYVTLIYNYTLTSDVVRSFTYTYPISGNATASSFMGNRDQHYGLGLFERILITVLITIVFVGLIAKFSNILAGLGAGLLILSYLSYIGFVEWWIIAPTLFAGFVVLTGLDRR